jgi:hypothetical protein
MLILNLAKKGYCGGDPEKISKMEVKWVFKLAEYEKFINNYEQEYIYLNKDNG